MERRATQRRTRSQANSSGEHAQAAPALPREVLLDEFADWLRVERGQAAESVRCYRSQAAKLLGSLAEPLDEAIAGLDPATVTGFVMTQATSARSVWSAKAQVTALRALLRFLDVRGLTSAPLVAAVPAVAGWRLAGLPQGLSHDHLAALLATPDTTTSIGLRDSAVLTLLTALGLRGAEVAALELHDIAWRHGEMVVHGRGAAPVSWRCWIRAPRCRRQTCCRTTTGG
jgi:site-specific recombinase XerD